MTEKECRKKREAYHNRFLQIWSENNKKKPKSGICPKCGCVVKTESMMDAEGYLEEIIECLNCDYKYASGRWIRDDLLHNGMGGTYNFWNPCRGVFSESSIKRKKHSMLKFLRSRKHIPDKKTGLRVRCPICGGTGKIRKYKELRRRDRRLR